jgi:Entner-Doudoroff aldolase
MTRDEALLRIEHGRIIAILRGDFGSAIDSLVDEIVSAGISAVEMALNSPNALDAITRLARRYEPAVAIGAGTVLSADEVHLASQAGASFIVSPEFDPAVVGTARRFGLAAFPGCYTPTEIGQALAAGADAVKLFPASSLGPAFLRAMRGPRPLLRAVPTGGVTVERAAEWISAGAWALGIGGELTGRTPADRAPGRVRARADAFVQACSTRSGV